MSRESTRSRVPAGRIDVHSHLLPGIDDGCLDLDESLECVRRLTQLGYVGTICTPHVWPDIFPQNTPAHIEAWTLDLSERLREHGLNYSVWPGGELRLFDGVIDWMKEHGVPTLASSRIVLTDLWLEQWPKWVEGCFEWLLSRHYRPVLAHPERLPSRDAEKHLERLVQMGVWLQGNFRSFTGEEGYDPDRIVRALLTDGKYQFLATDMHRPDSLEGRLDGIQLMVEEFGTELLDQLTIAAPRRLIFGG